MKHINIFRDKFSFACSVRHLDLHNSRFFLREIGTRKVYGDDHFLFKFLQQTWSVDRAGWCSFQILFAALLKWWYRKRRSFKTADLWLKNAICSFRQLKDISQFVYGAPKLDFFSFHSGALDERVPIRDHFCENLKWVFAAITSKKI